MKPDFFLLFSIISIRNNF